MRRRKVTDEAIRAAISGLLADGIKAERLSVRQLRERLGDVGSFTTLQSALDFWRRSRAEADREAASHVPPDVGTALGKAGEELWGRAKAWAQAQAATERNELAKQLREKERELTETLAEVARLEEDVADKARELEETALIKRQLEDQLLQAKADIGRRAAHEKELWEQIERAGNREQEATAKASAVLATAEALRLQLAAQDAAFIKVTSKAEAALTARLMAERRVGELEGAWASERETRQANERLHLSAMISKDAEIDGLRSELSSTKVRVDQLWEGECDLKASLTTHQAVEQELRLAMAAADERIKAADSRTALADERANKIAEVLSELTSLLKAEQMQTNGHST